MRKPTRRGLRGVKLVVSDAHEGLKATVTKVLSATWQRCRVHLMRNVLAAGKSGRRVASATPEAASVQWRAVADQIRPKVPKLETIMDDAEPDVLALHDLPEGTSRQAALDVRSIENGRDLLCGTARRGGLWDAHAPRRARQNALSPRRSSLENPRTGDLTVREYECLQWGRTWQDGLGDRLHPWDHPAHGRVSSR